MKPKDDTFHEGAPRPLILSDQAVHLLRTAVQATLTLSQMADQKASILMGASFVVFSIAVNGASRGAMNPAMACMGLFAFVAALLAVLAILPSAGGRAPPDDQANILFFGNFAHWSEGEFSDRLLDAIASDETVFRAMTRDLHQNGRVLKRRKYRFLRLAYLTFLCGLITTFAIFLGGVAWPGTGPSIR